MLGLNLWRTLCIQRPPSLAFSSSHQCLLLEISREPLTFHLINAQKTSLTWIVNALHGKVRGARDMRVMTCQSIALGSIRRRIPWGWGWSVSKKWPFMALGFLRLGSTRRGKATCWEGLEVGRHIGWQWNGNCWLVGRFVCSVTHCPPQLV